MSKAPIQRYWKASGDDDTGFWFDALGLVAFYFARLEWCSYAVVDRLGDVKDKSRAMEQNFKPRAKRAAELVRSQLATSDANLAGEWATFWQKATDAASMRNEILHNPLTVNLPGMRSFGNMEGIKLMKQPGSPLLELGEVQAYVDDLRTLDALMLDLFERTTFS